MREFRPDDAHAAQAQHSMRIRPRVRSRRWRFFFDLHPRSNVSGLRGRNHANIADADVASQIVTWILQVERDRGDL